VEERATFEKVPKRVARAKSPRGKRPSAKVSKDWKPEEQQVSTLWMARAIERACAQRVVEQARPDDPLVRALGIDHLIDDTVHGSATWTGTLDVHEALRDSIVRLGAAQLRRDSTSLRNVDTLGGLIGLDLVERDVLAFACEIRRHATVDQDLSNASDDPVCLLSEILGHAVEDVGRAASGDGLLARLGLVFVFDPDDEEGVMAPMRGLPQILARRYDSPSQILANFFRESPAPRLALDDFPHAARDVSLAVRLLRGAVGANGRGVNVLVYGPPGTGKTELVRAVARSAGSALYEVQADCVSGKTDGREARLGSYQLCQRMLAQAADTAVLFDEIEDVFPDHVMGGLGRDRSTGNGKAWLNRALEENARPTFWVSNEVGHMDPSFLRRFDLVVELHPPPQAVRRRVLAGYAEPLGVSPEWLDRASSDGRMAPAYAERAARVAALVGDRGAEAERTMDHVLASSLSFVPSSSRARRPSKSDEPFDPALLNPSCDVVALVESMARKAAAGLPVSGSICLYGPPGTGKTALAHHLAERMGRPLHARRFSDILGPYVGMTEQAIAGAFGAASREGAVLLLDEADGLLRSRAGATQSWEVTQVNELLVQMEHFDGVFVCSTNLFEHLDEASLRRFAVKVKFSPLRPEQRHELFCRYVQRLCGPTWFDGDAVQRLGAELARIGPLSPGDFAAVARRHALTGEVTSPLALVEALRSEVAARSAASRSPVGFA